MRIAPASEVRAMIAAHFGGEHSQPSELGDVTLHPHQREGVDRIRQRLREHGGALLADDVGLGKTFVALAVARSYAATVVIGPSALREAWTSAALRCGTSVRFLSVEMLGRAGAPACDPDLVIVDEAHLLRTPTTRRFMAASDLCRGADVLLLTATPVQNRLRDLRTVLSLFLGARAHAMLEPDLATHIVRRIETDVASAHLTLPSVRPPEWIDSVRDVDCLDRLLALPAPLPPADGDDGGVLLTYTLVRQWASSRAALRGALKRRLARARAMEDALQAGRLPSRTELLSWCFADDTQQLAFPELTVGRETAHAAPLLSQIREHAAAVRAMVGWLEVSPDPDRARAAALGEVLLRHRGERVIAFSEYSDTVSALYRLLAPRTRVAMLTHSGGRVAGGVLSRREVLARFAPGAGARAPARDAIDLLLTTDVLSEGVDLQDASVAVHLDLPWNPARMQQRVGRLRRIGASRASISVYMFAPPAPAERLLHLEERLRLKLAMAARSIGVAGAILPGLSTSNAAESLAPVEERLTTLIRSWRGAAPSPAAPIAGAVTSSCDGVLACVRSAGATLLVAIEGECVTTSRMTIARLAARAGGDNAPVSPDEVRGAWAQIECWLRRRVVSNVVDLPSLRVAHSRRAVLRRVETIARRAPRHVQPHLAPLMRAARTAATATLSAGAERVLDELARAPMHDRAWLHAVGEFASLHARAADETPGEVVALLILRKC